MASPSLVCVARLQRDSPTKLTPAALSPPGVSAADAVAARSWDASLVEPTSVAMSTLVQLPLTDSATCFLGGNVGARRGLGGGTLLAGAKQVFPSGTSVEASAQLGVRNQVTVGTMVPVSPNFSAGATGAWSPRDGGVGWTAVLERQLSDTARGHWHYTLGPGGGIATGFTHNGAAWATTGELRVGATLGATCSVVRPLGGPSGRSIRLAAKVGLSGLELEAGGGQRVGEGLSAGWAVTLGTAGVVLKLRITRGGVRFVFPVVLATMFDRRVALVAVIGPPVVGFALQTCVLVPARSLLAKRAAAAARRERAAEAAASRREACAAQQLLAPMAARKRAAEVEAHGLVIGCARWGQLPAQGDDAVTQPVVSAHSVNASPQPYFALAFIQRMA